MQNVQKRSNSVSLRGRSAAVAILKFEAWHPVAKHGSTKQEEIPITKTWESLRRSSFSLFIPRFCFVPAYHISLRNDKSIRQRLPRRAQKCALLAMTESVGLIENTECKIQALDSVKRFVFVD